MPLLTGAILVISKFSENANRLPWTQLIDSLLFSTLISMICWGLFFTIKLTRSSAGILGSVLTVVTMLWMLFSWTILPVAIILLAIAAVPQIKPHILYHVKGIGTLLTVIICLVSLFMAGIYNFTPTDKNTETIATGLKSTPNIYFIIPDRFPSHEALLESGYDNSEFIAYLEEAGYYTKDNQLSEDKIKPTDGAVDTSRTPRFVASVLNMDEYVDINTPYNVVSRMIKYHSVGKILKENGYEYHHVGTWWAETEVNEMATVNYVFQSSTLMPSEELPVAILDRSIFRYLTTYPMQYFRAWDTLDEVRRQQHLFQLQSYKDAIASSENPKFVFVHLILPHPPYVWNAEGQPQENLELSDMERYIEQIKFSESFLKQFIAEASEDDIVIIQSDEGMGFVDKELNKTLSNTQWNGVLTAWHIPGAEEEELAGLKHTEVLKYVIELLQ